MKIIHEEPGRRLELAETESRVSLRALVIGLGVVALVALPWRGLWAMLVHGAALEAADLVFSALWLVAGLSMLVGAFGGHRLEGLTADRGAGRLEWRRSHLLGLLRWNGGWALESLESLALASRPGSTRAKGALPLRLTLRRRSRRGSDERHFELRVDALERTDGIADLALRLGSAAGLPFYRVPLNEGDRFAIELRAAGGSGLDPVPAADGRSRQEGDAVSNAAAAAATTERQESFDPAAFRGSTRVTVWEPGREVRVDKGWGLSVLLSPLLLAVFLGPLSLRLPGLHQAPLLLRFVAFALITFAGLGIAAVGWAGLDTGLPRHVRLDWATRRLHVETLRQRRSLSFAEISGVELRNKSHTSGRRSGHMVRTSYWSQVRLALRSPARETDELVAQTRTFPEDASSPHLMAQPLARELAAALNVELRQTAPS